MLLDARRVVGPARKLRKLLRGACKRPAPQDIHDLRTTARRFETSVETLGCESKRASARMLDALAQIRKRAGKVRDLDVLTRKAATLRVDGEADCVVRLLENLGVERERQARKLKQLIDRRRTRLRRRLKRNEACRAAFLDQSGDQALRPTIELIVTALTLAAELKAPQPLNRNTLHAYRLKTKELRNLLQLLTGADDLELVRRLGETKDAIGEWHDWERLIEIAAETAADEHHQSCAMRHESSRIAEQHYRRALVAVRRLRRVLPHRLDDIVPRNGRPATGRGGPLFAAIAEAS
jgi:CHAD domain-containing protein